MIIIIDLLSSLLLIGDMFMEAGTLNSIDYLNSIFWFNLTYKII